VALDLQKQFGTPLSGKTKAPGKAIQAQKKPKPKQAEAIVNAPLDFELKD